MRKISRTDIAESDLLEIWCFIADDSPTKADRFYDRLEARIQRLADFPEMGSPHPELGKDVRSLVVGAYLILYRPTKDGVAILRVLHGARDLPPLLEE